MTENRMVAPGADHPAYQREPEQVRLAMPLTPAAAMALVAKCATSADEAWERLAAFCRSRGYVVSDWEMVDAEATADGVTIVVERRARVRLPEHAVPLLAGAEALEAVEVAKAALVELKKEYEGAGMADEKRKVTYKWSLTRINAALARLGGK